VAVPSRIQSKDKDVRNAKDLLKGWRIAVKDNFQIQHVRRSACNQAYYELYPPAQESASCIQALYDQGAVVVGTTKLASFAATEEPVECIDWQAPFNPRADKYQSPAGSSSGSGAAVAAYEWLDITIGSDSECRLDRWCMYLRLQRVEVAAVLVTGMAASRCALPMVISLIKVCSIAFLASMCPHSLDASWKNARSSQKRGMGRICQANIPTKQYVTLKPKQPRLTQLQDSLSIVWASDYMNLIGNEQQLELLKTFVKDLEDTFEVYQHAISFEEAWEKDPPKQANGASLSDYMKDVSRDSFFYEDYHNFEAFRKDYRDKFRRDAYISPPVRWQWYASDWRISE
jgi:hypothetical protein